MSACFNAFSLSLGCFLVPCCSVSQTLSATDGGDASVGGLKSNLEPNSLVGCTLASYFLSSFNAMAHFPVSWLGIPVGI
jgi:hypothetical protein